MNTHKVTLVVIIVLLIIFVPLTILGTTLHFKNQSVKDTNTNHAFKHNGKLHFYKEGQLLGTYTCEEEEYCDYAISKSNYPYALDEYKPDSPTKIELINERFAFLLDTTTENLAKAETILYDVSTGKKIGEYKEVKNYGIGIENNIYLVKNTNDKWGVIEFYDGVNLKIPFRYDYIGLANRIDAGTNHIMADAFAVLEGNEWKLINSNNKELISPTTEEIYSYSNSYIILKNTEGMHLVDYEGRQLLNGTYKNIDFYNKYLAIIDNNNKFYMYDPNGSKAVSKEYTVENKEDIYLKTEGNTISITINKELVETIAIL